jgi:hypothetical protein
MARSHANDVYRAVCDKDHMNVALWPEHPLGIGFLDCSDVDRQITCLPPI